MLDQDWPRDVPDSEHLDRIMRGMGVDRIRAHEVLDIERGGPGAVITV